MPENKAISDVVVIGAGLTGALIARRMAEANLQVVVLEAQPFPGMTLPGPQVAFCDVPQGFAALAEAMGSEQALEVWLLVRQGLDGLQQVAARFGVKCRRVPALRLARSEAEVTALQASEQLLRRAGYKVTLENAAEWGYPLALRFPDNLYLEVAPLVQALLQHPRIYVETQVDVTGVIPKGPTLDVVARRRWLSTHGVVLTPGAYAVRFSPALQRMVKPLGLHSVVCRTELPFTVPLVLDGGHTVLHPQQQHWRISAWTEQGGEQASWALLAEAAQVLCPAAAVLQRSSQWVAVTADGLPAVGELPDLPGAYLASGLGPWGLSWVGVVAERLAQLMLNDQSPGLLGLRRLGRF